MRLAISWGRMKQLKILHVANSFDPAGDVIRCVTELKKYSRHRHEYILADRHPYQDDYGYQEPALMEWNTEPGLVAHLFDWADVVLYHFVGWEKKWSGKGKPTAFRNINIYYNAETDRFWSLAGYNAASLDGYKLLASSHVGAADFLGQDRFRWLPDLVPIEDALYEPDWRERQPCISYIKHAAFLDGQAWPDGIAKQNLFKQKHPIVLFRRKTHATVVIDNVCDGHLGLAGLEAMSMGLPLVVFNHEKTRAALRDFAPEYPPISEVGPNPAEAMAAAVKLAINPDSGLRRAMRDWMERFYHSRRVIEKFWDSFFEEMAG